LQGFLGTDMARAVAFLDQALKALEAYQTTAPPGPGKPAAVEPARTGEAE
jgi:hypothetical protein